MIHDATVEVTCDAESGCGQIERIGLTYTPYHGYDDDDETIEGKLEQHGWLVEDGKHYCSQGCKAQS